MPQPQHILEAVAKIGAERSQDFYRALAAEKDPFARGEAAKNLASGVDRDRAQNLPVLKNLLTDSQVSVRLRAAVSLISLEEATDRSVVLEVLNSKNEGEQRRALQQLARLKSPEQRAFAKQRIEALATDRTVHEETCRAARQLLQDKSQR